MSEKGVETGAWARGDGSSTVFCIIPPRLSRIRPRLCEHFADDPRVEVVVDERLRRVPDEAGSALERRLRPGLEARRLGDPSAATVPLEQPPLPVELRPFADELVFVRQVPRAEAEAEFARAAAEWRARHREPEQEARELAITLIEATARLRRHGPLEPQRLIAVLRAQHTINRYRRAPRRR